MKKTLAILLALAMVFSTLTVAFAEGTLSTDAQACVTLGMLKGDTSAGVTADYVATAPKRIQAALLFLRLKGLEPAALAFTGTDNFADADQAAWAKPVMAYLKANPSLGFSGVGNNNFDPNGLMTASSYYKVVLTALGYKQSEAGVVGDFAWENVLAFAESKGLKNVAAVTNFTVNDLAIATIEGLKATVKDTTTTLAAQLIEQKAITEAQATQAGVYTPVPEKLAVESVKAANLKETVVTFNKEVDKETAEDAANYLLDDEDIAGTVALNADKKSVTITWNDGSELANQTEYDLTIDGVADVAGAALEEAVTVTFLANDTVLPVPESLTLVGPNKLKVVFSEPIKANDDQSVSVSDKDFDYDVNEITVDGNEATIELSDDELTAGDYSVELTGFKDFADLKALKKTFTLDYAKDTTAPVATIKSATQTKVVVEFNKPVYNGDPSEEQDLTADFFYHTYSSYNPVYVEASADNETYTLYFTEKAAQVADPDFTLGEDQTDRPLAEGNDKFVVVADGDNNITDAWGNELDDNMTFTVAIAADTTAPTVTKVTVVDQQTIKVYFSEPVTVDEDNFTVVDKDGDDAIIDDVTYNTDDDYATITFNDTLEGDYSLTVDGVTDTSLDENEIAKVTEKFNATDLGEPNVASADVVGVDGDDYDYIYVTFPEDMATSGANSVLNKDNYQIATNNGLLDLTSDDKIATFGGANRIKITLADNADGYRVASNDVAGLGGDVTLHVGRVADIEGNKVVALDTPLAVAGENTIDIAGVKTLSKKTIEITVNGQLKSVSKSDFTVDNNAKTGTAAASLYAISTWKIDDGQTIITAVLPAAHQLDTSADTNLTIAFATGDLVSIFGTEADADSFQDGVGGDVVEDGYAPSVVTDGVTMATDYKINIQFSEALAATNDTLYAQDLVVKNSKGDVLVPNLDYTTDVLTASPDILQITIDSSSDNATSGDYKVYSNSTIKYITDMSENKANAFTSVKTVDNLVP